MRYRGDTLRACPFCGGRGVLVQALAFDRDGLCVRYTGCGAGSRVVPYGAGLPRLDAEGKLVDRNRYVPYADAMNDAENAWNDRV